MKVTSCPASHELSDFVLGLLAEEDSISIEEHLLHCAKCAQQLEHNPDTDPLTDILRNLKNRPLYPNTSEIEPIQERLHASYQLISTKVSLHRSGVLNPDTKISSQITTTDAEQTRFDEKIPERIGHYVLKKELGHGGTGVVYQAWDEKLGRHVALKIILDRRLWSSQHTDRFLAEAATLAGLAHPQIVHIYEVGELQGRPYLVLEFLPGGDLASRLQGKPQHTQDSARMVMLLARASHHAHSQGVIHRDLKPANILVEEPAAEEQSSNRPLENLHVKIADFGLAKRIEAPGVTETGTILGTPGYLAPEVLTSPEDKLQVSPSVDVYSLGAILYEMLTGRPPFRGETAADTLVLVQTDSPITPRKLRPGLSRDLETICLHCLEKNPRHRYLTAKQLADDLEKFLKCEPLSIRPASILQRTIAWSKRRPALSALTGLLILTLTLLVGGSILYERRLHAELRKTEAARDRADSSYRSARESLERMLAKLDDPRRANVPQLQSLKREQQQELVQFLQSVTNNSSDDPVVMRDIAKALYTSGRFRSLLGEQEQARKDLQRSAEILSELIHKEPDDKSLFLQLAGNDQAMASTYRLGAEALQWNEKALGIQNQLLTRYPNDHDVQRQLAMSLHNIGSNYLVLNKLDGAEKYLHQSIKLLEQLPETETKLARLEFAETEINLALVYQNQKKNKLAEEYHLHALNRLESILKGDPHHIRVLLSLSGLRVNRANALMGEGKTQQALVMLDANLVELRSLLQREPDFNEARNRLFETQGTRGNVLGILKRHREAAEAFEDVVKLAPAQERDYFQLFVASNLAYCGDFRTSLPACYQAGQYAGLNAEQKAYLAMCYSMNAASVAKDAKLSSTEQIELQQQCKTGAIQWLNAAYQQAGSREWSQFLLASTVETFWKPLRDYQPAWDWVRQHPKKP